MSLLKYVVVYLYTLKLYCCGCYNKKKLNGQQVGRKDRWDFQVDRGRGGGIWAYKLHQKGLCNELNIQNRREIKATWQNMD